MSSYFGDQVILELCPLPAPLLLSSAYGALHGLTACSLKAQLPGTFLLPQGTFQLGHGSAHTTLLPLHKAFLSAHEVLRNSACTLPFLSSLSTEIFLNSCNSIRPIICNLIFNLSQSAGHTPGVPGKNQGQDGWHPLQGSLPSIHKLCSGLHLSLDAQVQKPCIRSR